MVSLRLARFTLVLVQGGSIYCLAEMVCILCISVLHLIMARRGRPKLKATERQSRSVTLRFTQDEYKSLEHQADKHKRSISDYIRYKLELRKDERS